MKLLVILFFGAFVPISVSAQARSSSDGVSARSGAGGVVSRVVGTVMDIRARQSGVDLIVRTDKNALTYLAGKHAQFITHDGRALDPADIRLGDRLAVQKDGRIQDMSQQIVNVRGIVSLASTGTGDSMIVQVDHSWSVVVDTAGSTHYVDRSHETSEVAEVQDSDMVQVRGVYDSTLGEMTQTRSLTRLGPFRQARHR